MSQVYTAIYSYYIINNKKKAYRLTVEIFQKLYGQ